MDFLSIEPPVQVAECQKPITVLCAGRGE